MLPSHSDDPFTSHGVTYHSKNAVNNNTFNKIEREKTDSRFGIHLTAIEPFSIMYTPIMNLGQCQTPAWRNLSRPHP